MSADPSRVKPLSARCVPGDLPRESTVDEDERRAHGTPSDGHAVERNWSVSGVGVAGAREVAGSTGVEDGGEDGRRC